MEHEKIIPYMDFPYVGQAEGKDAFNETLHWGDIVAFMINHYDDRFASMCKGKVVGFTNMFIKIQPIIDDSCTCYGKWKVCNFVDGEYVPKEYVYRQSHRVIKLK